MAIVPYTGQDEFALANRDQDCRGWPVADTQGRLLGAVAEMLVDTDANRIDSIVLDNGERIPATAIALRNGAVEVNVVTGNEGSPRMSDSPNAIDEGSFASAAPSVAATTPAHVAATNTPAADAGLSVPSSSMTTTDLDDTASHPGVADAPRIESTALVTNAGAVPAALATRDDRNERDQTSAHEAHGVPLRPVDDLLGKSIISRATGNKLGAVQDLIVDPVAGAVLGLAARTPDDRTYVIERREIHSYGPDAVMVNSDESVSMLESSPLVGPPLAKKDLTGTKIITESGKLLGEIANLYVRPSAEPLIIYEIRESILDRLLGRSRFLPASLGRAMSEKAERIVVPDDAEQFAADNLDACAARLPRLSDEEDTMIRSRGGEHGTAARG